MEGLTLKENLMLRFWERPAQWVITWRYDPPVPLKVKHLTRPHHLHNRFYLYHHHKLQLNLILQIHCHSNIYFQTIFLTSKIIIIIIIHTSTLNQIQQIKKRIIFNG